jgi:hypothetical protein
MKLQACRRHPSAGRFMATCSGCTKELFDLETANRKAAAATADTVRHIVVGPYTVTTRRLDAPGGFAYGTSVHRPAGEDDALAFDMAEGAPLLIDEIGAYDRGQAHRDYVALANEYADLAGI